MDVHARQKTRPTVTNTYHHGSVFFCSAPNRSTGYTPFFMVYGAEAVLPSDIRHDSPHVAAYVEANNEQARQDALGLLDEERDLAAARSTIYQ